MEREEKIRELERVSALFRLGGDSLHRLGVVCVLRYAVPNFGVFYRATDGPFRAV